MELLYSSHRIESYDGTERSAPSQRQAKRLTPDPEAEPVACFPRRQVYVCMYTVQYVTGYMTMWESTVKDENTYGDSLPKIAH